jgi:VanZ family protein
VKPWTVSSVERNRPTVSAISARWTIVMIYAAGIFAASSTPQPFGVQELPPFVDKVIHAAVFGGFSLTVWMALRYSAPRVSTVRLSLLAVLIATLYGLSDEIHQSFVPGRTMDGLDVVADAIGACLAQAMIVMRSAARKPDDLGSVARSVPGSAP